MLRYTIAVAFSFALIVAGLSFSGSAGAQQASPAVIGVVDVQAVLRESTAMKSIQNQVEKKRGEFQGEVSGEEKRLREMEQELKRQQSVLAADAFAVKRRDFEAQVTAVQRQVQERRRVLDQAYGEGLRVVQKELAGIIATIAEESGFTLVLPQTQTLYSKPGQAVTDDVLSRLNKNLPDVSLSFKTPSAQSGQ